MQLGPSQDVALLHHRGIYLPPHPRALYCSVITTNYYCPPASEDFFFPNKNGKLEEHETESPREVKGKDKTLISTNVKQLKEEHS